MLARSQGLRDLIDREIRAQLPRDPTQRNNFLEFLQFIRASSHLLSPQNFQRSQLGDRLTEQIRALLRVSLYSYCWVRPIEGWGCDRDNMRSLDDQFHSLLRFLFAKYPVPRFMNRVWFGGAASGYYHGIRIFLKLARGIGPRQCELPVRLTKHQAGHFMAAPDDLRLLEAIRWSQVLASGGSSQMARTILKTRLCDQQEDEAFWIQTIQWLCRVERDDPSVLGEGEIVEIVNFAQLHRFEPASRVLGYPTEDAHPLQPNLTFRGRSIRSVRRLMVNWRRQVTVPEPLGLIRGQRKSSWESIGISGLRLEQEQEVWTIEELLTGHELQVEGGIMQHCVGTYDRDCIRGESSIWSVRVTRKNRSKRVLTVELCPRNRLILQARGKCNSEPTVAVQKLVRHWARRERLVWRG